MAIENSNDGNIPSASCFDMDVSNHVLLMICVVAFTAVGIHIREAMSAHCLFQNGCKAFSVSFGCVDFWLINVKDYLFETLSSPVKLVLSYLHSPFLARSI